jgi:hypothetical protein
MGKMMRRDNGRQAWARFLTAGVVAAGFSCDGDDVTEPTLGSLEIAITTSGTSPDEDGYTIALDGGSETALGRDEGIRFERLQPGNHVVRLADIATNCVVQGENPRTVEVTAGASTPLSIIVLCDALTGSIEVSTTTSGGSVDADGYSWTLDAETPRLIGINETALVGSLSVSPHR